MPVRALLDTHTFLWFIGGNDELSRNAREVIECRDNLLFISAASLWEIAIKNGLGKLALGGPFHEVIPEQVHSQHLETLQIELSHLSEVVRLPLHHRDPFDRLIVAQARVEGLPIISVDETLDAYGVQRIW